eukprot:CAMPEP_0206611360 /NCGR_PEP_ID=MMETSP0325_2-20121206/55211_1 /ASSEMBLY_ACC=CAM_ASM_000347 /TAXON_ID=2866 /ORGANISM="Crypthecodinium cohnii, Strain Seligo" /LENGTH=719 /DNA_ID=CAMNT_0054130573 /DNA_START=257 /DNA_END=2415 /DNA_ORIENTATION=-
MSVAIKQYAWDIVGEAMLRAASLSENAESCFGTGDFLASATAASEASETFENLRLRAHDIEVRARSAWLGEDLSNPKFGMGFLNQVQLLLQKNLEPSVRKSFDESGQEDVPAEPTKRKRTRRHRRHRKSSAADQILPDAEDVEGMPISNLPSVEEGLVNVATGDAFSFEKVEATLEVGMRLRVLPGTKLVVDQVEYYRAGDIGVITKFYSDTARCQERFGIAWERTSKSTTASLSSWRRWFSVVSENASDAPTDIPDSSEEDISPPSSPKLQCKRIPGRPALTVTSAEFGAPFEIFEAPSNEWEEWLMLGHGVHNDLILIKESPLVRRASSWRCCWQQGGGGNGIAIYVPECDDPNYVACGAIFLNEEQNKTEPRMDFPVAVVHKSVVELVPLEADFWPPSHPLSASSCSDSESDFGAIVTKVVPSMNTVWPVPLSGQPAMCYTIKSALRRSFSFDLASLKVRTCLENLNWEVRNTFVDLPATVDPALSDFFPRRGWYSAPASPRGRRSQSPGVLSLKDFEKENEQDNDNEDEDGNVLNADAPVATAVAASEFEADSVAQKCAAILPFLDDDDMRAFTATCRSFSDRTKSIQDVPVEQFGSAQPSIASVAAPMPVQMANNVVVMSIPTMHQAQPIMQPLVQLFTGNPAARPEDESWSWMGVPVGSFGGNPICMQQLGLAVALLAKPPTIETMWSGPVAELQQQHLVVPISMFSVLKQVV